MGGPVHEILVAPGQTVTAGTPLLTVNSPDYSVARSAYIKAKDALLLADKAYTRAQDLYQHGAIAESDLQAAESARNQAEADMVSSRDALHALGIKDPDFVLKSPGKTTLEIPLVAPVSGEVVERLVGPGQLLQAGVTQCFTISDMTQGLGARERLPERSGLRSRRGHRHDQHGRLPRAVSRQNFLHRPRP